MKKVFLTIAFLLICVFSASAQTDTEKLKECSQFLSKSVDEITACKKANDSKQTVIDGQNKQIGQLREILEAKNETIETLKKTLKILSAMKCNQTKTTFFFIWKKTTKKCF